LNTQNDAFSIGSGTSTSISGSLVDGSALYPDAESCDTGSVEGTLSGSISNGNGYLITVNSSYNSGYAITGVAGTKMTGFKYWYGAGTPPATPSSYSECESQEQANKSDPNSSWYCLEFTATNLTPTNPAPPTTGKLDIVLEGKRGSAPNTVMVTMTLKNTGASDVSGLSFTDPTGLENDGVVLSKGNIGPTKSGLTLTSGPTPSLPTTLPANGSPVVVHYTYTASTSGDAVLVASASGTDASGNTVSAKNAITVLVSNPPANEADYQRLVTSALLADNSVTSEAQNSIANTEATGLAATFGVATTTPGQQAAAVSLGLPTQLGVLVGSPYASQWVDNYFATLATDLKGGASYLGDTGKAVATQLLVAATDPETQDKILGRVWDGIEALPGNTKAALASTAANLGYFSQALKASLTPEGQDLWVNASVSQLNSLKSNVSYAVDGFTASKVADVNAYNKDPVAYMNANSAYYANETYGLVKTEVITLLGDGVAKGIGLAARSAGFSSLASDATAIDSSVAATVDSTAPVAADSTAALTQKAEVATSQFQTLPAATPLAVDQAAQLGGLVPGDQVGIQKALKYIKDTFGVDLELGVRTSEPLSVGINGSPKLSFMKPKAVSFMDQLMGAPKEIAAYVEPGDAASGQVFNGGVTTVFKPVPIPAADLAAIGETNPSFVTQYEARFASQTKLWNEYQDANSTLRVLVQGSAASEDGVTAIASVPGFPVPPPPAGAQPLVYLQQLDQPAFVQQFGLTSEQAQALKASLAKSPGAVEVDYIARPNPDGSVSFFDGLNNNRPFVSDLDLQYVQPANGAPWPPGLMSKIQLEFKNQLEQNVSRLPDHGASGTAFDLPAASIGVADGFVMATADPAFAQTVANNLATRYASQSAIFSSNAARLEAQALLTSDPAQAMALRDLATKFRQTAATFSKVDAAYLLAKYPPGEKIIVIKLGDVRVGYGK
jgi:hypothetical protein